MAEQNATKTIKDIVKTWAFKYKISKDDTLLYLEHGYDCFRSLHLQHDRLFKETKLTTNSLGIVSLPDDCVEVISLYIPWEGRKWTFTRKKDWVSTTTDGSFDSDYGEGQGYTDDWRVGYGAHGGNNDYYYDINWSDRLITVDNFLSDTFTLAYVSTGVNLTASTYAPINSINVFDTYLTWKKAEIDGASINERRDKERLYTDALKMFRLQNRPTYDEFRDQILALYSQAPVR